MLAGIAPSLSHEPSYSSLDSASELYNKPVAYTPDYNVRALCDLQFLKIRRAFYLAAYRASLMERHPRHANMANEDAGSVTGEDTFTREWRRATSVQPPDPTANPSFLIDSPEDFKPGDSDSTPAEQESENPASPVVIANGIDSVDGDVPGRTSGGGHNATESKSASQESINKTNQHPAALDDVTVDIDDVKKDNVKDVRNNVQAGDPEV